MDKGKVWMPGVRLIILSVPSFIDGSCAGLVSMVVWLSQINRQEQSDSIK